MLQNVKRRVEPAAGPMDWTTRKVLVWRLSNTMDAGFCVEALEEALMDSHWKCNGLKKASAVVRHGSTCVRCCTSFVNSDLASFGKPEIFNTDQGSQYTSQAFTSVLRDAEVRISMDGRGRWITYYNTQRPHSGLAGRTPVEAYRHIGQSHHGGYASMM